MAIDARARYARDPARYESRHDQAAQGHGRGYGTVAVTASRWAELRQIGFATLDHAAAVRTATELLALGPGFGDPLLAELGLADFTAPVGPGTYVEVLAPVTPGHPVARWLGKVGGSSGLGAVDPGPVAGRGERTRRGARRAECAETQAMGHDIIQLHPLDVGVLLELDAFLPRDGWFWDDLPAAQAAQAARTAKADDILAVDVAVTGPRDPAAMARTWAVIIGIEPPVATADGAVLAFGGRSGSCPPGAAGPGSSPSTCTPPTASTGPASRACCAIP